MKWYIYRCFDVSDRLIYIGCSTDPQGTRAYNHKRVTPWHKEMARLVVSSSFTNRREAFAAELKAINEERPTYNIIGMLTRSGMSVQERLSKIKNMQASGFSLKEIGEELGITKQRVHQIVRGIDPNKRKAKV